MEKINLGKAIQIGLPRGLLYYEYGCLWQSFFESLGAQIVVSGETTKEMLNKGGILDEVCLPVKVYVGHVASLAGKTDCLFVPRIVSVARQTYTCPKIMGLPDIIRSNISDLPELIDTNINLRQHSIGILDAVINTGRRLGQSKTASISAWYFAWRQNKAKRALPVAQSAKIRVGLLGHKYLIYDKFISMNALDKLVAAGVDIITPDMVPADQIDKAARGIEKKIYWSYCHELAGAALALIEQQLVDGLVFMTSFSCGPDSLISEIIKRRAQAGNVSFMLLNLDEHTAEAGLLTRIEAFTDMLKRRKRQ